MPQHVEFPNSRADASNSFGHSCMALFEGFPWAFAFFLCIKVCRKTL